MKYIKQFDNYFDTNAYANEIIEKPLVLLNTGGGPDDQLFFSDGELRSAIYNVSDDDLLCVTSLAPFKVFKVDGGENLIPEMKTIQKRFTLNADTIYNENPNPDDPTESKFVSTVDPNMQYISKMLLVFENGYNTNDTLMSFNDVIEFGYIGYYTGFYENLQFKPIDTIENLINDGRIEIIDNKTINVTQLLCRDYVPITMDWYEQKFNYINSLIYAARIQSEDNSFSLSDIINIDVIIEGIEYVTDSEAYSFNISDQNFKTMSNSSFNSHPLNYIYGAYPINTNYDYIIEYDNDILPNDVVICASKQLNSISAIDINTSEIGSVEYLTSIKNLEAEEHIININNETVVVDWSSPGDEEGFNLFPVTYLSDDIPMLDFYNEQTLNFTMDPEKNYLLAIYDGEVIEILCDITEDNGLIINDNSVTIPEAFFIDIKNDFYGFYCVITYDWDEVNDMPNNFNLVESTLIMQIPENPYKATIENNKLSISFNPSMKFDTQICFYLERDGVLLETTNTFYRTTSKLQDAYYFETAGEHTIEFEYIDKFMNSGGILLKANYDNYKMTSTYVTCNPLFYQLPYKINDKFFNYECSLESYGFSDGRMIDDIQLSNKVPLNIGYDIIDKWLMYSDKNSDPNINYDSLITINNCVIDSFSKTCVYIGSGDIVIPNIVTSISEWAARDCKATSIVFPNSLTRIEPEFRSDTLTKIKIPSSINYINRTSCPNLSEINISDISQFININKFDSWSGKPKLILNNQNITNLVVPLGTTEIKDYIFSNFSDITSVTIPDSVTSIGGYAFYGCSGLTSVNIPNIKSWMNISFSGTVGNPLYYAKNLYLNNELITDLIIPNSVTAIKSYSFVNSSLETVQIPNSVTSIGRCAFNGTTLKTINIPDSVTLIDEYAFADSSLETVTLPNSITDIPERTFSNCQNLKSINIPNSVTSIGSYAFAECPNIEEIIFERESYDIKRYSFGNSHIKHLSIKNLKAIPEYAFYNCSFDELTIGENLNSIWYNSFNKLSTVQKINIPSIEHWCKMTFYNTSVHPLSSGIAKLYVNDNPITDVIIPNSITTINSYAFYNYKLMTSITIPSSVTQIQNNAFSECTGLTKTNIENLESWCKLSLGGTTANPIRYSKNLYINDQLVTDLNIPNTITVLPDGIFYNCESLIKLTLPSTLTSIGQATFRGCANLSEIICNAMTAPTIATNTFMNIKTGGVLKVPTGATGYDTWMSTSNHYLGKYGWTIQYI